MMLRFKPLVLAPLCLGLLTTSSNAQPAKGQLPPINPIPRRMLRSADSPGDFIMFRTVENHIDCELLGTPLFSGNYVSKESIIEVDSNVDMQVSYAIGTNLKNGQFTIPTTFQFALRGVAIADGSTVSSPTENSYTTFGALPDRKANDTGTIIFPANLPYITKGLKARVIAERHGLEDHAGNYSTQIVLSWGRL